MLYLLFYLGDERYVLAADQILEILPLVEIHPIPQAPAGIVGLFNHRGAPIPLLDLSEMALGTPSQHWFSTRVILVRHRGRLFGLIMERATETIRLEPSEFTASPIKVAGTSFQGAIATDDQGLIRRLELDELLSANLHEILSSWSGESADATS